MSASKTKGSKKAARPKSRPAPDLDSVLGQFSDALAFVECAVGAQDDLKGINGPALLVLEYGLAEIHKAYSALDRAVAEL